MTIAPRVEWNELVRELYPDTTPHDVTTVFIVAHPDDEIIGAGATLLPHAPRCTIVHVTDGAPRDLADAHAAGFVTREAYAIARRAEAQRALALARSSACEIVELGIEDQRAVYDVVAVASRLATLLRVTPAPLVVTHPYEGGHPDHDATAFAVHAARDILRDEGMFVPLLELTSYYNRDGQTIHSEFLPHPRARPPLSLVLSPAEQTLKRQMFQCFETQREVLRWFPVEVERFRVAPTYDFAQPPHPGTLHYEQYSWGMDGQTWRRLAREARAMLTGRT